MVNNNNKNFNIEIMMEMHKDKIHHQMIRLLLINILLKRQKLKNQEIMLINKIILLAILKLNLKVSELEFRNHIINFNLINKNYE